MSKSFPTPVDMTAASLSGLCLLHCLALPVAAAGLPLLGLMAESEWIHQALVLAAIPASGYAVTVRNAHYRDYAFAILALFGLAIMTAAAFVEAFHDFEQPMTAVGAILVAIVHLRRWSAHRRLTIHSGE